MAIDENRQSTCPICAGERLPPGVIQAGKQGEKVVVQGRVNAVVHPGEAHFPPFKDFCTVPLYPMGKGHVIYLKFRTSPEMDRLGLTADDRIQVEGCRHQVDGKPLVFDVRNLEIVA